MRSRGRLVDGRGSVSGFDLRDQPFTATIVNVQLVDSIRATKRGEGQ